MVSDKYIYMHVNESLFFSSISCICACWRIEQIFQAIIQYVFIIKLLWKLYVEYLAFIINRQRYSGLAKTLQRITFGQQDACWVSRVYNYRDLGAAD